MAKGKQRPAAGRSQKSDPVTREFKSFKFELESSTDEGEFSGYAAVFGNVDSGGDIIEKGAFARTIVDDFDRIKILSQHNSYELPIGKPLELREDDKGLYIRGKISDTQAGRDIRTLLKDGVLAELSIGYDALDYEVDATGVRHLKEIKLWEVSIVTWAMNDQAKIDGVKSLVAGLTADVKAGRITRSRMDALRMFLAVVKELADTLGDFLDPPEPEDSDHPPEPTTQQNFGKGAKPKGADPKKQTKSAGIIFEIIPTKTGGT